MRSILDQILTTYSSVYSGWIAWNLFLAFIPLVLSFWLFRRRRGRSGAVVKRSFLWWLGLVTYVAFLPNAPYLLTDIIHLIHGTRATNSTWAIALVIIPLHVFAILSGFEAYVVSVLNQGHYLKRLGAKHLIGSVELLTHALCSIGIYMGRFRRFNSWDLVTIPSNVIATTIDDLTQKFPLAVILVTFIFLTLFYWLMKQITLGIVLRIRYARAGRDVIE